MQTLGGKKRKETDKEAGSDLVQGPVVEEDVTHVEQ